MARTNREWRSVMGVLVSACPVVCIAALVLLQGGFFHLATCACGLVASVLAAVAWLRRPLRQARLPIVPLLFAAIALAYLISAMANGASLTTLSETGAWAACAGVAFLVAAQNESQRARSLSALTWFGVVTSVAAFLVYVGVLPIEGGVTEARLEFTFQYANATAIWFGVCTLLCLLGTDGRMRTLAALPVAAMLLTQSGGAVLSFLVVAGAAGVWLHKSGNQEALLDALVQGVFGIALFAVIMTLASPASLLAVVVTVAICLMLRRHMERFTSRFDVSVATRALAGLLLLLLIAATALLQGRIQQALNSLVERLYHVRDGLSLWMTRPLCGVGPDNWQYLFRYIQTGPYDVSVVHSSPVQMLDDAGILALLPLLAACVLGVRALVKRVSEHSQQALAELACAGLLLLHSVLEFDLQFGALSCLVALLLCGPDGPSIGEAAPTTRRVNLKRGLTVGIVSLVLCVPLCVVGLACAMSTTMLQRTNAAHEYEATRQRFWANTWAIADPAAQGEYLAACFGLGDYDEVIASYGRMAAPSEESTLYAAIALSSQGRRDEATTTLIEALQARPYDEALLGGARRFSQTSGIDPAQRARLDEAMGRTAQRIAESELVVRREQLG